MRARTTLIFPLVVLLFIVIGLFPETRSGTTPIVIQKDKNIIVVESHDLRVFFNNGVSLIESFPNTSIISGLFDGHLLYLVGTFRGHPSLFILDPLNLSLAKVYYIPNKSGVLFSLSSIKGKVICVGYIKEGVTYDGLELIIDSDSELSKGFIYSASLHNISVPTYFRDIAVGEKETIIVGDAYWKGIYFPSIVVQDSEATTILSWRMYVTTSSFTSLSNSNFVVKGLLTNSTEKVYLLIEKRDALYLSKLVDNSLLLKRIEGKYSDSQIIKKGNTSWFVLACLENSSKVLITNESICSLDLKSNYFFVKDHHLLYISNSGKFLEACMSGCSTLKFVGKILNLTPINLFYKFYETPISMSEVGLNVSSYEKVNASITGEHLNVNKTIAGGVTISQEINRSSSPLGTFIGRSIGLFIAGVALLILSYFIKHKIS